ncbi:thermonuclease family protein [Paenarthrobacter sp. Z7-10]|uniref:thermonuclease family protein n=1 Tax=Paenarthrobacter sp. Z7-10 TaxID=2787635 RepID=UPI0022A9163C|nr:thermonuclease family protein [Paenarthrobacter sp. Z7-10]MCZ2404569.1 thermonuclease family protein [Paenarthrobacter sp. Z7-10]
MVISINNHDQTVRLLNVDTPETKDPNAAVECLGPEATKYLQDSLPAGTHVRLDFDAERHDKYGRTLAAVSTDSGSLVNAEIAKRGLGIPMSVGGNTKYLAKVQAAHAQAKAAKQGLFSTSIGCALPAQIEEATAGLTQQADGGLAASSASAATAITETTTAIAAAKIIQARLTNGPDAGKPFLWAAFTTADISAHLGRLNAAIVRANNKSAALTTRHDKLVAAEVKAAAVKKAAAEKAAADKRAAAARAAAAKKAVDEQAAAERRAAAEQLAAEKAAAAAAAAEAERIRNLPPPYVPPAYVPTPATAAPADPYPGYHGPRCYAPGGQTYTPC